MSGFDLVVVGGGVHGCTAALFCARAGMRVAVIERDGLCRGASGVNAGTLTLQMTRVALIPYAMRAQAMWATARDWLGHDVGVVLCEGLSLAFTAAEEGMLADRATRRREAGAPIRLVSAEAARRIEPGLGDGIRLAAHATTDGFAAAHLTGLAYRRALAQAEVTVIEGTAATGVDQDQGFVVRTGGGPVRGARLLLAGGVWIEPMLAWLGVVLPIKVLVNQLIVTARMAPVMRTVVGVASGLLSLKQYPHGSVLIGGGWQGEGTRDGTPPGTGTRLLPDNLVGNARLAALAIPALHRATMLRAWAGLEAETADALPAAGPVPGVDGAFVCGSVHSGYTSGPYIARLVADRILDRTPELPLFPIDRLIPA